MLILKLDHTFVDNQGYPYIWPSHYYKDSQISWSNLIKTVLIVTHFVNLKHNFPIEIETVQREKLEDASVFVRISVSYP